MSGLQTQLLSVFGAALAEPAVQLAGQLVGAYLMVVWLASIGVLVRDTRRRFTPSLAPWVVGLLAFLSTPVFLPLTIMVYGILRPGQTRAEREEQRLIGVALAAAVPDPANTCPGCGAGSQDQWVRCPECATPQREPCTRCGQMIELRWSICPWCAKDHAPGVPENEAAAAVMVPAAIERRGEVRRHPSEAAFAARPRDVRRAAQV